MSEYTEIGNGEKQKYSQFHILLEIRGVKCRRNRRHIIATPNDPPIVTNTPGIHDGQMFRRNRSNMIATPNDPPIVTNTPAIPTVPEHQDTTVPGQPTVHVEHKSPNHTPIRTRSGREVKKPDRLIEHY